MQKSLASFSVAFMAAVSLLSAGCKSPSACCSAPEEPTATSSRPQTPVTLTIDPNGPGAAIPADFMGLSFEMSRVLADTNGGHYFSATNKALLKTFHTLGIKNLRVGGNTVDRPTVPIPSHADVDNLFAFAKAADIKVIFALRLRDSTPEAVVERAKYIADRYSGNLLYFAVGNEPNVYIKGANATGDYCEQAKKYMAAINAVAPQARFCGPGTISGNWSTAYARAFAHADLVKLVTQHNYTGGSAYKVTNNPAGAIDKMLSPAWQESYEKAWNSFVPVAKESGIPYRLEEANNFFNGGAKDVSDTFAAALWGLDYLYWWAGHDATGVNFHTGDFVAAGERNTPCRYAVFWSAPDGYAVHPLGYAVKAFSLGSQGRLVPATLSTNNDNVNLAAYAVVGSQKELYVTLINKDHGAAARDAIVTIAPTQPYRRAKITRLAANQITDTTGVTLGGAEITDTAAWKGKWETVSAAEGGRFVVNIPAASAAVIRLKGE